jgi:hypothetical protein
MSKRKTVGEPRVSSFSVVMANQTFPSKVIWHSLKIIPLTNLVKKIRLLLLIKSKIA